MPNWTNNSLSHHCCGWPFFIKAAGRYSIGKHLIDRIRALESPPNTPSDPPPPNHTIDKVLEIMGAIAANMKRINGSSGCSKAEALIEKNWTSTFGPWVRFLLQNVILAPEGPSDVSGVDRLENAFLCIPGLLTFSTDQDSSTSKIVTFMASVRCTSPEVPHLITQTWIKVLGDHHPTWGDWTYLMTTVVHSLVESEPCSKRPDIPSSGLCEGDHQIGLDFISHINHQTQRMLKMSWGEMHSFRLSLALMNDDTFTNDCPLYLESLRPYSLPAVIKLLSSALRRRRETSEVPPTTSTDSDTGFDKCAYDIGIFATLFLIRMIKDHHWVVEALRHGIVNAIFNIHPFFFQYEVRVKRRDVTLAEVFTTMFLRISGFLVYHSALHQFSRVDRKIRASHEMEKRLKSSCKELYDAWKHAQENASILRALRHAGKEDGCLTLCSSIQLLSSVQKNASRQKKKRSTFSICVVRHARQLCTVPAHVKGSIGKMVIENSVWKL
ncbi:hypothetical protein L218DRAFT_618519 [Marasmius fiardii PR-910]|nr:hypothetical protein L218DRAFT_618519 [Marasmius fiardii PR-910]